MWWGEVRLAMVVVVSWSDEGGGGLEEIASARWVS